MSAVYWLAGVVGLLLFGYLLHALLCAGEQS